MRDIRVDDDLYQYIMSLSEHGEGASAILRRELGFSGEPHPSDAPTTASAAASRDKEFIHAVVASPEFLACRTRTAKYLAVLAKVYERDPDAFPRILRLGGRGRVYFADSREAIATSGRSTQPHPIPGTRYWALTNLDSDKKYELLRRALRLIGYDEAAAEIAANAI